MEKRLKKKSMNCFHCWNERQGKESLVELKEDELVLVRVPHQSVALDKQIYKFFHLYEGPFRIHKRIGENAFLLTEIDRPDVIHGTYNHCSLKKYHRASDASVVAEW